MFSTTPQEMAKQPTEFDPMPMDSEDDLFITYTSGTTNKPTRIVHTHAGYLLYAAFTHKVCVVATKETVEYLCGVSMLNHKYAVPLDLLGVHYMCNINLQCTYVLWVLNSTIHILNIQA